MDSLSPRSLAVCLGAGIALSCLGARAEDIGARAKSPVHHVPPPVAAGLAPLGHLSATNEMRLSFFLQPSARKLAELEGFVQSVSTPGGANYHKFLTVPQFVDRFAPSIAERTSVKEFASTNGLSVVEESANGLRVAVKGTVTAVEHAINVHLNSYQHPTEERTFFAPDREPTIPDSMPIGQIGGLHNFYRPMPHARVKEKGAIAAHGGSGSAGAYFGWDFRNVYMPNCPYTGAGQTIGVLAVGGYDATGWNAFKSATGITNTLNVNAVGGYGGGTSGTYLTEVMLDIEMAAAGAPAYGGTNGATIYVVEISPSSSTLDDGFNAMASANYSVGTCSYGITGTGTYPDGDSTAHTIFLEMAAQGMTMCNATGDSAAVCWTNTSSKYYNPAYVPTGDPYVLQFGATTLTTTGSGSSIGYGSEQIWMYSTTVGSETGSTGGYSMTYTNLPYQKTNGINYTVNGGSSTMRNFPDLVLVGDDVQVNVTSSQTNVVMGSSCAAPFGAGLIASINQESLQNTGSRLGFMNPTLYALALGPKGSRYFRQNISGNNVWGGSIGYYTVNGTYDFAKGLGSLYNFNMVVPPPTPIGLRIVPVGH